MLNELSMKVLPESIARLGDAEFGMSRENGETRLVIFAPNPSAFEGFEGETTAHDSGSLFRAPLTPHNAVKVSERFPWLKPHPLGLRTSAGMGDRLGLATPGHVRAMRAVCATVGDESALAPIYPQQSIREMQRTDRTPAQVMADAQWGVFAEGWRNGFGADADHLKAPEHIDRCAGVGFTFYTIDPGEHVDSAAASDPPGMLGHRFDSLPWQELEDTSADLLRRYVGRKWTVEGHTISFDEETLRRAAVKYGRVVAFVTRMYRYLRQVAPNAEMEVSIDETETVTTHAEHLYIVNELKRLGVQWVSLAPRYVGRFEKGVDYIGDLKAFEADFAVHAAIARQFGPYKLSLHSGSDKFSIYPIAVEQTRGLVHLKTAGTSYLEALRTIADVDPAFFRDIYRFSLTRYDTDRASYHVSAERSRAPSPDTLSDIDLPELFEQFDARQVLHVTFGSVLTAHDDQGRFQFRDRLLKLLRAEPERYAANLEKHFIRHLQPFVTKHHG